jgi:hypothetical protein
MTSSYLTVAVPYANAAPHLGNSYELVLADVAARAAEAAGIPTEELVTSHGERFAALKFRSGHLGIVAGEVFGHSRRLWES